MRIAIGIIRLLLCLMACMPHTLQAGASGNESPVLAVRLQTGDIITYEYRRFSRERAGSGEDKFHQERLMTGTVHVCILDFDDGTGGEIAIVADLRDGIVDGEWGANPPAWTNLHEISFCRMGPDLQPCTGRNRADSALQPVHVEPFYPGIDLQRLLRPGTWQDVPDSGPIVAEIRNHEVKPVGKDGLILYSILTDDGTHDYGQKFVLDVSNRVMRAFESVYHECHGGGNVRIVTYACETGRERPDEAGKAELSAVAYRLKQAISLRRNQPEQAKRILESMLAEHKKRLFAQAMEAELSRWQLEDAALRE